MNERRLARYLLSVECGYRRDLYHCGTHAADVLRTLHVVCTRGGVWEGLDLPDSARFAMLLAAVVHDYEHKQKTNDFLVSVAAAVWGPSGRCGGHGRARLQAQVEDERLSGGCGGCGVGAVWRIWALLSQPGGPKHSLDWGVCF
eukprot:364739-Chlamydomonas_euryale.AAC.2